MSYDPLPHTSGVHSPMTAIPSIHGSEHRGAQTPNIQSEGAPPSLQQQQQQTHKKRRPSKSKAPSEIRRSSSTPHMRNLALNTSGELSPTTDKRRNKLGYHRTSVACGHCRRRKIRCLIAPDDPQGRCANCIRLKKECNFYPVEQNPESQRSQTGSTKESNTGAPASSTTSSPCHPSSVSGDNKVEEYRVPLTGSASHTPISRYGMHPDMEIDPTQGPPSSGMHVQRPPFPPYPPTIETQWATPGYLPSSSVAETSPSSSRYWHPSPTTAHSTYESESNFSGTYTPGTMSSASNMSYGGHHETSSWAPPGMPPPTRSMSYGNIEGLPQHYTNPGLGIQQSEHPRRTSPYPYPTTIDTNHSSIHTTTLGSATPAPLSAPILPNQPYGYSQPWSQSYGGLPQQHDARVPGRSMSAQWYGESGQLHQVQEESSPPVSYTHHGMQQYYSGS